MPQLTTAAKSGQLSRQISILAAGEEGKIDLDDLALKKNFSLGKCAAHAITMNSLMASHLAAMHPDTTFIHMSPGAVGTNILSGLGIPKIVKNGILFAMK